MFLSGRPLMDNPVDAAYFVDRDEPLSRIDRALSRGLNVLVSGEPGMGKTSLLRHVMYRARTEGSEPVGDFPMRFVRAEGISDGSELLSRIAGTTGQSEAACLESLAAERATIVDETLARWKSEGSDATGAILNPAIIVDDVTATAGHALFGRLRDELWETGWQWIVSVRSNDRGAVLTPPADAFFETVIDLEPMTVDAANELFTGRTDVHFGALPAEVTRVVGGNPRRMIATLRDLMDMPTSDIRQRLDLMRWRDNQIHMLGRSESMLAFELEARGSASASDKDLLNRLGWTRARAVQVATKLEEAGLVVGEDAASTGQGRPRKLYRLVSPEELMARNVDVGVSL